MSYSIKEIKLMLNILTFSILGITIGLVLILEPLVCDMVIIELVTTIIGSILCAVGAHASSEVSRLEKEIKRGLRDI